MKFMRASYKFSTKVYLFILLLISALFLFHFYPWFFTNPNEIISSVDGDGLKSYFVSMSYIKNQNFPNDFSGDSLCKTKLCRVLQCFNLNFLFAFCRSVFSDTEKFFFTRFFFGCGSVFNYYAQPANVQDPGTSIVYVCSFLSTFMVLA